MKFEIFFEFEESVSRTFLCEFSVSIISEVVEDNVSDWTVNDFLIDLLIHCFVMKCSGTKIAVIAIK